MLAPRPLVLAIVFAMLALPGIAFGKPKVAIYPLENDSGDVQEAVVDALEGGELTVVGPKQVARAADKLGLEGDLSDKELKKLANELDADAVVQGSLSSKGANKVLHFKLFVKGKKQKGFKIEFGSAKSAKFKKMLKDKLVEKLGDMKGGGGGDDDEDKPKKKKGGGDDEDKPKKKKGGGDDDENPIASAKKKGGGDDDEDKPKKKKGGDDDEDKPKKKKGGDDDDEDKPHKKRTASADEDGDEEGVHGRIELEGAGGRATNKYALRVDAGISLTGRSLTFNSRTFTEGVGSPKPYSNAPVPGARVEGDLFPLAFGNPNSPAAGLGIGGYYDRTFSLTLHNQKQPATAFPATEFRWNIGVRYRIAFGSKSTAPTLTLGFDYGHRQFKIDRSNQMSDIVIDIPDVEYVGVIPNATFRIPLAPQVAIVLGGGSLLAMRAGSIQAPEQYGQAKITSFEAFGGLDITFAKKYAIRLTGDFSLYGFAFTGNGAMANARDGDPASPDVGGASDRYIGGAATFAVMY